MKTKKEETSPRLKMLRKIFKKTNERNNELSAAQFIILAILLLLIMVATWTYLGGK